MGAALIAIGMFASSLTENQGFAAGIAIPVLLLNYYSVTLAEYVSSSAFGSLVAIVVIAVLIGFLVRFLTKNSTLAYVVGFALSAIAMVVFYIDSSRFEGLLLDIMSKLSLFERFNTIVSGVFDLTSIVFYATVIIFFLFLSV